MTDVKELALRVVKESPWYYDNEPVGDSDAIDFAQRFLAAYLAEQEPVATILGSDPFDEREGVRFDIGDLMKLSKLPKGTKLFTASPEPAPQQERCPICKDTGKTCCDYEPAPQPDSPHVRAES